MNSNCNLVIISDKAYNAIIRESFAKHPVETGGVLLGYILDNGIWVVMEMIPPGINAIFQTAYFEYDQDFVNYLGTSIANQYKEPLQVLGLWHRHPGAMDYFSSTDDGTNLDFASRNPYGVISGLVNIDPKFRLTMYHLDPVQGPRPRNVAYTTVNVEVGDDLIPERFFRLRYVDGENTDLNPLPSQHNQPVAREIPKTSRNNEEDESSKQEVCSTETNKQGNRARKKYSILKSPLALGAVLLLMGLGTGYFLGKFTLQKESSFASVREKATEMKCETTCKSVETQSSASSVTNGVPVSQQGHQNVVENTTEPTDPLNSVSDSDDDDKIFDMLKND